MTDYDLILRGGRIIDPGQHLDQVADLAFADGKVAALGTNLAGQAAEEHDVSGQIVTAGLIDLHTHVYWGGTSLGIDPDSYGRSSAVTTVIDTGSAGPGNFAGFRHHVIAEAQVRILAYLHISHAGIFGFSNRIMVGESENISLMDPLTAIDVSLANRDVIIGIKVRLGRHASGTQGMAPLAYAMDVADACQLPLMVHIDEPPPSYLEVVAQLRPGDILTHCFRPLPNTPVDGEGNVHDAVVEARRRGVLFDIGHGMGSFSFDVARTMLRNDFYPDTISSDVHALCIDGPAFDQLTTLSKFLNLGMPLDRVIACSTVAPAGAISKPALADLTVGSAGDASVLSLDSGRFDFVDSTGSVLTGDQKLSAAGVVLSGRWWPTD